MSNDNVGGDNSGDDNTVSDNNDGSNDSGNKKPTVEDLDNTPPPPINGGSEGIIDDFDFIVNYNDLSDPSINFFIQ